MHPTRSAIALDESVSNAITKGLRMRGIDVTMSSEEGLIGASDAKMMAIADASTRSANIFNINIFNIIGAFAL